MYWVSRSAGGHLHAVLGILLLGFGDARGRQIVTTGMVPFGLELSL